MLPSWQIPTEMYVSAIQIQYYEISIQIQLTRPPCDLVWKKTMIQVLIEKSADMEKLTQDVNNV